MEERPSLVELPKLQTGNATSTGLCCTFGMRGSAIPFGTRTRQRGDTLVYLHAAVMNRYSGSSQCTT